jgi:hypothetical protein
MRTLISATLLSVMAISAASAEIVRVNPRRTRDYDERANQGYCAIRLWVDDEVNVFVQGGTITFENVRGQRSRDAGTECSQPMPRGTSLSDFQFKGIDGRGRVELIEEPMPRNGFRAWVRILDSKGGGEEHHFRLSWRNIWTSQNQGPGSFGRGGRDFPDNGRTGRWNGPGGGFDGVCFYTKKLFEGKEYCSAIGDHRANVGPEFNDRFESVRFFGRARQLEIFDNENFGGPFARINSDQGDLKDVRGSQGVRMDKRVTSFRVF